MPTSITLVARRFSGGVCTGVLATLGWFPVAHAQNADRPLACERARIVPVNCPTGHACGPGSGPGMSQLMGSPGDTGAQGSAEASLAIDPALRQRTVRFSYSVPNVALFAPAKLRNVWVDSTQVWVIKSDNPPGPEASNIRVQHRPEDPSVATWGRALGTGLAGSKHWLIVGQVQGSHATALGRRRAVSFAFACPLPVQNLVPLMR
jgi:hypothetical protein